MHKHCLLIYMLSLLLTPAAAQRLEKITLTGTSYFGTTPGNLTLVGNKLFFSANDSTNRISLYVTTGTDATATRLTTNNITGVSQLMGFNGKLYFTCDDGVHGTELWESNGTVEGTKLYADIYTGAESSNPAALTATEKLLFFVAKNSTGTPKMFSSDGAPGGVYMIRSQRTFFFDYYGGFAVLNNEVYFKGADGPGLWKSDGTVQGTVMINSDINPMAPGGKVGVLNGKLYFAGRDLVYGTELWVTDGTALGTMLVKNIYPDQPTLKYSSLPGGFTVFNNSLYFSADDGIHGEELFITDGSEAGTHIVKDIVPGLTGSRPSQMIAVEGALYISCFGSKELWKTNGDEATTTLISQVYVPWYFRAIWNNEVYSPGGQLGAYLYKTGGTATTTRYVKADNTFYLIATCNTVEPLVVLNGCLYFCGSYPGVSDYSELLRLVPTMVTRTYTFTGSGNWSNPANWAGGTAAPSVLKQGDIVLINQNCVLDIPVQALAGATITVAAGKNLLVQGALTIQ